MKHTVCTILVLLLFVGVGYSQSLTDASAAMQVSSTTQGFLPPQMTEAQRDAIPSPAAGLVVYNTTTNKLNNYDGTQWVVAGTQTPTFLIDDDGDTQVQVEETGDEDKIRFDTAGTERMIIDDSGNVGIGITPRTKLEVDGEIATSLRMTMLQGTNTSTRTWSIDNTAGRFRIFTQPDIATAGNEYLSILDNGNVGIGSWGSPTQRLHVDGSLRVEDHIYDSNNETGTTGQVLSSTASGTDWVGLGSITTFADGDGDTQIQVEESGDEDKIRFDTAGTERMIIDDSGNVGIGTITPSEKFHLEGDGIIKGDLHIGPGSLVSDIWKDAITFENFGLVGTQGSYGLAMTFNTSRVANGSNYKLLGAGPSGSPYNYGSLLEISSSGLAFKTVSGKQTNGTPFPGSDFENRFLIKFNGNVGIGTTNPSDKLHITSPHSQLRLTDSDDSKFIQMSYSGGGLAFRPNSTTDTPTLYVGNNGNVGIGLSNPSVPLHISGTFRTNGGKLEFNKSDGTGTNAWIGPLNTSPYTAANPSLHIGGMDGAGSSRRISMWGDTHFHGNVGISTTAPSQRLHVNGNIRITGTIVDSNNQGGSVGEVLKRTSSGIDWQSSAVLSDKRIKKDIKDYTKGLSEIMQIRPVSYQYNEKSPYENPSGQPMVGIIAQEIQKVLPSTVSEMKTEHFDDLLTYDDNEVLYALINAVKELKAENDALRARVDKLEKE